MQINNYTSSKRNYTWTGRYTRNQLWSFIRVEEPIIVDRIDVYWGGYDRGTKGRHFLAKVDSNKAGTLKGIVAQSSVISVPQGRGWRRASVKPTLIEPGSYVAGVWGDPTGRRIVGAWNGDGGTIIFTHENSSIQGNVTGDQWRNKPGVIPARLNGESPGTMRIKVGSTWRKGQAWAKAGSTWRKAKGVWVRAGSTWRRGK